MTDSRVLYSVLTNMPITKNKGFTKDWLRWDSDSVSGRIWVKHHTCMSGQHSLCSDRAYSSPAHLADTIANKNAVGHFSSTVSRSLNGSCWNLMEGEPVAFDREAPCYLHEELSNEGTTSQSSSFWGLTHAVFFWLLPLFLSWGGPALLQQFMLKLENGMGCGGPLESTCFPFQHEYVYKWICCFGRWSY